MSDLINRLRGQYPIGPNGEYGTRDFASFIPPIALEAANEIERQQAIFLAVNAERQLLSETIVGQQTEIERLRAELNDFRTRLCFGFSDHPYLDDGELQDNSRHPSIDYKRETPESIIQKITGNQRKELERLNARIKELEVLSQGLNTRKVFVCIHCEGLYSDEPVSECDCMSGANTFIEGIAYIPEIKDLK